MCIKSFLRTLYGRRNDMFTSTVVCEFKNTSSIVLKNYEVMACWLISPFYCDHVFTKQCDYSIIIVRTRQSIASASVYLRNCAFEITSDLYDNVAVQCCTFLFWVTDGQVVRADVSVTWNVVSWSGGHEFEPRWVELGVLHTSVLCRTWIKI